MNTNYAQYFQIEMTKMSNELKDFVDEEYRSYILQTSNPIDKDVFIKLMAFMFAADHMLDNEKWVNDDELASTLHTLTGVTFDVYDEFLYQTAVMYGSDVSPL